MSNRITTRRLAALSLGIAIPLLTAGCAYDYLQRTDRVAYSAGDAVKANLEGQTTDPSSDAQYDTDGLGKDGNVAADETAGDDTTGDEATPDG